jgi:hypothetical protein
MFTEHRTPFPIPFSTARNPDSYRFASTIKSAGRCTFAPSFSHPLFTSMLHRPLFILLLFARTISNCSFAFLYFSLIVLLHRTYLYCIKTCPVCPEPLPSCPVSSIRPCAIARLLSLNFSLARSCYLSRSTRLHARCLFRCCQLTGLPRNRILSAHLSHHFASRPSGSSP